VDERSVNRASATGAALDRQPRLPLARLPTPLHDAQRLRSTLGGELRCPRILLKRDDLTDLALGGNKARKLEYIAGDALERGFTALVTAGAVQSNHARMTAAAAAIAGLRCALVLASESAAPPARGNLLLDRLLGAETHFFEAGDDEAAERREEEKIGEVMQAMRDRGERPLHVPIGGSNAIGTLGYVQATRELTEQLRAMDETPVRLYYASGSRGTQAGLELGARLFNATYRCVGIAVSGGESEKRERAGSIAREAAERLGVDVELDADEMHTEQQYYGSGYAVPTPAAMDALRLLARTEGVFLDPVYTAKAMAGMIDHITSGSIDPRATLVFLHTGGTPGMFGHAGRIEALLGT